jgi:hypothetical protein
VQTDEDFDAVGDVCDVHFDGGLVVDHVEGLTNDVVYVLTAIEPLPGRNGLIGRLYEVARQVGDAYRAAEEGRLAAYDQRLADALAALDAFDRGVAAKVIAGQLAEEQAADLAERSAELRVLVERLREHGFVP